MLILTAEEVRAALPMEQAIRAMKDAYAALSGGRAQVPLRSRLEVAPHEGLTLLMPAFVKGTANEALGVKVVSLFPGNPRQGIPYIQAVVLVLEPDTGRVKAILEGSSLTAIRTGAAGGAAVDVLSRPQSSVLAIFGAGVQARTQLLAACTVRTIERVWVFDPNRQSAEALVSDLAGTPPVPQDLRVASSPQQATQDADIICTATTSLTPVFADSDLKAGVHVSAIGSYTPEMQEIPAETVSRARVVVDSKSAALAETGDLIKPIEAGLFTPEGIHAELGEIILGRKAGRESTAEVTVFKSVGVAAQDAIAADVAVKKAREMGLGQEIEF
jgi:ornithine cyclodeaminase/alanine dehydrogenase-like protein (mu-crystallin family)